MSEQLPAYRWLLGLVTDICRFPLWLFAGLIRYDWPRRTKVGKVLLILEITSLYLFLAVISPVVVVVLITTLLLAVLFFICRLIFVYGQYLNQRADELIYLASGKLFLMADRAFEKYVEITYEEGPTRD